MTGTRTVATSIDDAHTSVPTEDRPRLHSVGSPRAAGSEGLCSVEAVPLAGSDDIRGGRARLTLLRDFALECDGERVGVAPSAQRLIGFLAIQTGQQVRRSYVSGCLWPDSSETRAQASLRSALWRGPVLGDEQIIHANATHLWLSPEVDVDVHAATARAKRLLDLDAVDPASIDIMSEVAAFGSDILVGWYDEWMDAERERFRQLRLHVLDQLGELLLRAQRYAEAVEVGLVALLSDSLRESTHRLLVRAHLCEGNLAEAVRQYRTYANLLAKELGVRPSAAMEKLMAAAVSEVNMPRLNGRLVARRAPSASA